MSEKKYIWIIHWICFKSHLQLSVDRFLTVDGAGNHRICYAEARKNT